MNLNLTTFAKQNIAAFLFILVMSGCSKSDDTNKTTMSQGAFALPVNTFETKSSSVPIAIEYPGKVTSAKQVQITARVVGTLENKYYTEGSYVKKGELLYKIDSKRYQAVYDSAIAGLSTAEAQYNEAKRNFDRVEKLYKTNALSQKDYDAALSAYESAKAAVQSAKAAITTAKIDLDYTNVEATISGMTGLKSVDIGTYVGTNSENSLLATITQMDPIYVEFSVPDVELLRQRYMLKSGKWDNITNAKLPVSIRMSDGNIYEYNGTLDFFDNVINAQTGSIQARATFKNPNYTLLPGLFVRVSVLGIEREDTITVPQIALMQDSAGMFVYISNNGTVEKVPVVVGESTRDGSSIITQGLKGGEIIILNNLTKIGPGAKVNPVQQKG